MKRTRRSRLIRHRGSRAVVVGALAIAVLALSGACAPKEEIVQGADVRALATAYTEAWGSQEAARVASHYAENGSLKINDGAPAVGRAAITASAQAFMTAFPDMVVTMDSLRVNGNRAVYHWTLTGTNTGPGGTGKSVRISGYEEWTLGVDGLIRESLGHFDEAEYQRQLREGAAVPTS